MTTATRLARRFDAGHSCLYPTRDRATDFDAWLGAFWTASCPPEPDTCPDAVSLLDGFGTRAIRWYDQDGEVFGYVPGLPSRCYRVPVGAVEPSLDGVLDEEGPVCDGDDRPPADPTDLLLALVPLPELVTPLATRPSAPPANQDHEPDNGVDRVGRNGWSGGDRLPAGDLFHRQEEGIRQVLD